MSAKKTLKPVRANTSLFSSTMISSKKSIRGGTPDSKGNSASIMKPSGEPLVDWDLVCALEYNDYLQALAKDLIVEKTVAAHEQILKDQLAIKENTLSEIQGKLLREQTKNSKKIDHFIDKLEENTIKLNKLQEQYDLINNIKKLNDTLEGLTSSIRIKNIEPITDQSSFNKFKVLLEENITEIEKIKNSGRTFDSCGKLVKIIGTFFSLKDEVENKIIDLQQTQDETAVICLKTISDTLAANYN